MAQTISLDDSLVQVRLLEGGDYQVSLDGGATYSRPLPQRREIKLRYRVFDPVLEAVTDEMPAALQAADDHTTYIVQFETQPLAAYQAELQSMDVSIYFPLADQALIVGMDAKTREAIAELPYVRWIGAYHPAYKLEEVLLDGVMADGLLEEARYSIMLLQRGEVMQESVSKVVESIGGVVLLRHPQGFRLEAQLDSDQLLAVAQQSEVLFIDRWSPPEVDMDIAREIGGGNYIESVQGYTGHGVRAEVMDLGLRHSHENIQNNPPISHGGSWGASSGRHGTAVYNIVFGDGAVQPLARGMMPDAQGFFASYGMLAGIGGNVSRYDHTAELVDPAGPYRAVLQTNSWGGARTTQYTTISAELDDIIFQNDLLILQSQSNAGDRRSRPQAWSKNVVSVGAVNHEDTLDKTDDSWTAGNASIGPAEDGRIKPDLVHFYDKTFTARYNEDYIYGEFGGTSGATPITAGHFGLMFQMWADGVFAGWPGQARDVFASRPHMTTAKALMINSADQYPFTGTDHDMTRVHQGWGMADLQNLYDVAAVNRWSLPLLVDENSVLAPFETDTYQISVVGETWLKATMVYADPMGVPSSSQHRINDLSLRVTAPDGTVYWGNNGLLSGNWSTPGGSSNTVDTVENVFIELAEPGLWTIEVLADEIVQDAHLETAALDADYALVVTEVDEDNVSNDIVYLSTYHSGSVGGINFADEDILAFDTGTGFWSMYYDGSDVGVTRNVDALTILNETSMLMSFNTTTTLYNAAGTAFTADDSDIVQYFAESTGANSRGYFEPYLRGADVGLTTFAEDVDAIALTDAGQLIISTIGSYNVPTIGGTLRGKDEDLLLVDTATQTLSLYFDGSDVGLSNTGYEDVWDAWVDANGYIYLTTQGNFAVPGLTGDGVDIFVCIPGSIGPVTSCDTFLMYGDGSAHGLSNEMIDAFSISRPLPDAELVGVANGVSVDR